MALILVVLQKRGIFRGQLIKLYLIAYLVYRFASEFIRPEQALAFGLTGYQWACLVLVPVFGLLWIKDSRALRETKETQRSIQVALPLDVK